MRFAVRTLRALVILAACAGVLALGVWRYADATADEGEGRPPRAAPERTYTVRVDEVALTTAQPVLTAYGTIAARRVLELRAAQGGRIVDLAPDFVEGASVEAGQVLARIDPATTRSRQTDAETALADARSSQTEADQALALSRAELEAAIRQANLRRQALERQRGLAGRGVAATSVVENAELALSQAEQAVATRRSAYAAARQRVEQAANAVARAVTALGDAARDVADTAVQAPFAGLLSDTGAVLGGLVAPNERLAALIDLASLEASFRVTDAQFARLIGEDGALLPLEAAVVLDLGAREVEARAVLDRAAATVGAEGGRTLYARIVAEGPTPLRPGDFVTVRVNEPPLDAVAEVPARAVSENGLIFVVNEDGRLSETGVEVLRRGPETLLVRGLDEGARIVGARQPQLGPGIRVRSFEEARAAEAEAKAERAEGGGEGRGRGRGRPGS